MALGLLALGCALGSDRSTPTWQQPETKNHPRKNVVVQFTDASLHPSTSQVLEGGTLTWVNYASESDGSIVFSEEVARALPCDLRPNWMETEEGYQSIPITIGAAENDLELPCIPAPGTYEYEVWLFTPGAHRFGEMADPQSQLKGRIVVK
jgi:plastocyanin